MARNPNQARKNRSRSLIRSKNRDVKVVVNLANPANLTPDDVIL
jgi:hypothetical protein